MDLPAGFNSLHSTAYTELHNLWHNLAKKAVGHVLLLHVAPMFCITSQTAQFIFIYFGYFMYSLTASLEVYKQNTIILSMNSTKTNNSKTSDKLNAVSYGTMNSAIFCQQGATSTLLFCFVFPQCTFLPAQFVNCCFYVFCAYFSSGFNCLNDF